MRGRILRREEANVHKDRREKRQREVESWLAYTDVDMRSMLVSPLPPLALIPSLPNHQPPSADNTHTRIQTHT